MRADNALSSGMPSTVITIVSPMNQPVNVTHQFCHDPNPKMNQIPVGPIRPDTKEPMSAAIMINAATYFPDLTVIASAYLSFLKKPLYKAHGMNA